MKGKAWLVLSIAVAAVVVWQVGSHPRRAVSPPDGEVSVPAVHRNDLTQTEAPLDAAPKAERAEAQMAENRTAASGAPTPLPQITSTIRLHGCARDQIGDPIIGREIWLVSELSNPEGADRVCLRSRSRADRVAETTSNIKGTFYLDAPGPGDWWIGIAPLGDRDGPEDLYRIAEHLVLRPEERDREIDLRAFRGLVVCGTVVKSDGSPAPMALVDASLSIDGQTIAHVKADETGDYCVGPLPPGSCFVQASMPDRESPSDAQLTASGATNVRLRLLVGGRCRVSVVDRQSGEPVPAALRFVLRGGREDDGPWDHAVQGYKDVFDVTGLDEGIYDWIAETNQREIGVLRGVTVRADGIPQELVVQVEPPASLVVASKRGDLAPGLRAGWDIELYSDGALIGMMYLGLEESKIEFVPPGPIRLRVYRPPGEQQPSKPEEGDYWSRKGVRIIDVVADESETRRVEIIPD